MPASTGRGRVLHFTSVHYTYDNRIFEKEAASLARAGFEVILVAADPGVERVEQGIRIVPVPKPRSRYRRMLVTTWQVLRKALQQKADIHIFHDPELILQGLILRLLGKKVIFDVHEDYYTAIMDRSAYLPRWARPVMAGGYYLVERLTRRAFVTLIAERYYARRFPEAVPVLNYPRLEQFEAVLAAQPADPPAEPRLLYTGGLSAARGALLYAELLRRMPDASVRIVGYTPEELAAQMRKAAGAGADRLRIEGEGAFLPFAAILAAYQEPATAGMAVMAESGHYREKELTKFFEYMAAGLPIIASDFPVWKALIEGQGVGICVDPKDPAAIEAALRRLVADPALAKAMGARGRAAVRAVFNWDQEAARLISTIESMLGAAERR